jgi:hypothetical protein
LVPAIRLSSGGICFFKLRPYLNFNSDYWKKTKINQGAKCELKMSRTEICRENGKLGGRPKGSLNKVSCEIRALAQLSAPDAFAELARLAREAQSEQTRVAAIKEILDRAYGRPTPPIDGDGQGGAVVVNVVTGVRG